MSTAPVFERYLEQLDSEQGLSPEAIQDLAAEADVLSLGMLADVVRRRLHGTRVTYLRVAESPLETAFADHVPQAARELRLTGTPSDLAAALTAVEAARVVAEDRTISAFSWADVEHLSAGDQAVHVLARLRSAGLDSIQYVPLDALADPQAVLGALTEAGFSQLRLTFDKATAADRLRLLLLAGELQQSFDCIQAINPLPMSLPTFRPTTGYDDVKMVAIARLAAPEVASIQVDWRRYGPKLAQVALTFGADDVDNVSALDEAPEGRRRAPLEEIRRNIEAAGFQAAERDGRHAVVE